MIRYGRSETKVFPYPDTVYLRAHTQDNVVVCSHNMIKKHNFFVAGGVPREAKNLGVELTAFRSRTSRRSCSDRTSILKKANLLNEVSRRSVCVCRCTVKLCSNEYDGTNHFHSLLPKYAIINV